MKLAETLRTLGRRWYIVVFGLVLTLGMTMFIEAKVPTTYQATGSILLMPPEATVGAKGNPYLWLGGLNTALDVLVRRTSAVEVSGPILKKYPDSEISIASDPTTSSAIILVRADAPTADDALKLRDEGMASVVRTLAVMQDESTVKEDLRIHGESLVIDGKATPKTKTRMQLLIVAGGGGIAGTLFLASLIDGWFMDKRQRKATNAKIPPPDKPAKPGAPKPGHPAPQLTTHQLPVPNEAAAIRRQDSRVLATHNSQARDAESAGTPLKIP